MSEDKAKEAERKNYSLEEVLEPLRAGKPLDPYDCFMWHHGKCGYCGVGFYLLMFAEVGYANVKVKF